VLYVIMFEAFPCHPPFIQWRHYPVQSPAAWEPAGPWR